MGISKRIIEGSNSGCIPSSAAESAIAADNIAKLENKFLKGTAVYEDYVRLRFYNNGGSHECQNCSLHLDECTCPDY